MIRSALLVAVLSGIGLLTFTQEAYAYLDPGTASIVLQGLIGGIAAALAAGAFYWQRVKQVFFKMFGRGRHVGLGTARSEDE